jgi:hypothetical protein
MDDRIIIAFTGPIGSGKSFAAKYLEEAHGFDVHKMAGPLKNMLRAVGLTERHIEGDLKEVPCEVLCGKTPRLAMQTLGTEWGRDIIGADLWVNLWRHTLPKGDVVCDDVRFPNEAAMLRSMGGIIVKIERDGFEAKTTHASEAFIGIAPHITIRNDGTDAFCLALDELVASQELVTEE